MKQFFPIVLIATGSLFASTGGFAAAADASTPAKTNAIENAKQEADAIGNAVTTDLTHTMHPDAQWFADAGLGLFIHWGIASVKGINISWSMRDGLNGKPAQITPNDYFAMAKDFNPKEYNPDKWLKAAKDAGVVYVVLTTRHHEGFAMWPSAYGDFNTKNYLGGRDFVKEFVESARRNGLKVGLYYSPPDWHFDRDYMNFSMRKDSPPLGPDLKPRTTDKTPKEKAEHTKAYAAMVNGQLEELLTRYGKIDLLWFDGKIPGTNGDGVMPIERIRELQPGIVLDGRFHGHGDFQTYERKLGTDKVARGWAEYCNTWTDFWPYVKDAEYRAPGFIIGQYVKCRSLHINYLPDLGPMSNGDLEDEAYQQLATFRDWMKTNGESVQGTLPLLENESASVPGTRSTNTTGTVARYLFALPKFVGTSGTNDPTLVYSENLLPAEAVNLTFNSQLGKPLSVKLLTDGQPLDFTADKNVITVKLPAARRSKLVDVVKLEFSIP